MVRTIHITFHGNSTATGWNIMPASSHNTIGFESSDLVTTNAETTGITMSVLKAFYSTVATLPNTGNNTGVYPDIIVRTAFRVNNTSGETPFLRFNGLISGRVYEIDILGNSSIENSITQYIVTDSMGSQSISKLITMLMNQLWPNLLER